MATTTVPAGTPLPDSLLQEIKEFEAVCCHRQKFNSRLDNLMNVVGILVSLGIVACGIWELGKYAALLGGLMTAIVSAQRAFPFNQRWQFYRVLDSQANNLLTEVQQALVTKEHAVGVLKSMRLDFAQQIPRGSTFHPEAVPPEQPADEGTQAKSAAAH